MSSGFTKFNHMSDNTPGSQSIYSELKLSDHLAHQLQLVKDQVDDLNEQLEQSLYKNQ